MGQLSKTIQILVTAGISAAAVVMITGCDSTAKTAQNNGGLRGDVTDVRPIEPAGPTAYQPPMYDTSAVVPTSQQQVSMDPVMASSSVTPAISSSPTFTGASGKSHKVVRGETLFSIAKISYGDGKAWKKIASANPGVSPSKLKVGQVLAMP